MPLWWWAGPPAFMSSTPPHECSPPMLVKASIWGYYCFLINLSTILILSLHLQHYVDQVFDTPVRQEVRHFLTKAPPLATLLKSQQMNHHFILPLTPQPSTSLFQQATWNLRVNVTVKQVYLQGKEIHTLTRPKQSTSRGKRFLAALLDSFASPTLAHPSQRRKASPDQTWSQQPQLSPNLLLWLPSGESPGNFFPK